MGNFQYDGDNIHSIKNNTIIGGCNDEDDQQQEMLRNMLQKQLMNVPGATPMNTQMDDE